MWVYPDFIQIARPIAPDRTQVQPSTQILENPEAVVIDQFEN